MTLIPGGRFLMGAVPGDQPPHEGYRVSFSKEEPQHEVELDAFHIDIHPVTNAQYRKFVEATGHPEPRGEHYETPTADMTVVELWKDARFNRDDQPVVGITWRDAVAYAHWIGKRLPTEAEWEKAARGGLVNKLYPWGDNPPDGSQCKHDDVDIGFSQTYPVCVYAPNGYGLYDIAGNVWELCADDEIDYSDSPRVNPIGPTTTNVRASRGAGGAPGPFHARCSRRGGFPLDVASTNLGFRCAQDSG